MLWPSTTNKWSADENKPSPAREAANSSKTGKREQSRRELVYQSDFTAAFNLATPLSLSQLLHFTHVRLCRSANWMHPIFRERPTYCTNMTLVTTSWYLERARHFSGSEALRRAASSLQIHDGQPAMCNLQRRVWVATTWINFWLSKQLWRQEEDMRRRVALWDWNLRMVQKFVSPPRWHPYPSHLLRIVIYDKGDRDHYSQTGLLLSLGMPSSWVWSSVFYSPCGNDLWRSVAL